MTKGIQNEEIKGESKMKIGLFTDSYPPYINGVSTSVYNLREALKKLGHTVYIVTVNNSIIKHVYDEN